MYELKQMKDCWTLIMIGCLFIVMVLLLRKTDLDGFISGYGGVLADPYLSACKPEAMCIEFDNRLI